MKPAAASADNSALATQFHKKCGLGITPLTLRRVGLGFSITARLFPTCAAHDTGMLLQPRSLGRKSTPRAR